MRSINNSAKVSNFRKENFDAVIIGAGVGGLVCGCYLAKKGKKVLILERNSKVGGYCTSFERNGYRFDGGVHGFESFGRTGKLTSLCDDLKLWKYFEILRIDPSDIFYFNEKKIGLWNDYGKTHNELCLMFPDEAAGLKRFHKFITKESFFSLYKTCRKITFENLLKLFFTDQKLISFFSSLTRVQGVPASIISALNSILFIKEYLLDNGYYLRGGVQSFPNALAKRFVEYGGTIKLCSEATDIVFKSGKIIGVKTAFDDFIPARTVISNADMTYTFSNLIDGKYLPPMAKKIINRYITTSSVFLIYLGLRKSFQFEKSLNVWFFNDWDQSQRFNQIFHKKKLYTEDFLLTQAPYSENLSKTAFISMNVPFKNRLFWKKNQHVIAESLLQGLQLKYPGVRDIIDFFTFSTPDDLKKYSLNRDGALHGWAGTPAQIFTPLILRRFPYRLFFTGHWFPFPGQGGIPSVVTQAKNLAVSILGDEA